MGTRSGYEFRLSEGGLPVWQSRHAWIEHGVSNLVEHACFVGLTQSMLREKR